MNQFTHLHVHSEFSLLDGFSRIPDLTARAKELGMTSLALTDHGVMFGVLDFYKACKKEGLKPIIGSEIYVAPRDMLSKEGREDAHPAHLVLLAKNMTGYKNLMKIVSAGYVDGFYYKPRVDRNLLRQYSEGIIALSACIAGEIPRAILKGDMKRAEELCLEYEDIFGKDNFYLEIQDHRIREEGIVRSGIETLSKKTGIGMVATNDVHYVNREDSKTHDVLICLQTGTKVRDENRMHYVDEAYYLKSPEEMAREFGAYPEALANTQKIADMIDLTLEDGGNHMPEFVLPEPYTKADDYLKSLCLAGLAERYETITPEITERLNTELYTIHSMGFDNYFLVVWDFIRYAKENGIMTGPGRGSAAGSIVAYTLGITSLDPIKYQLLFERFLNSERYTMPDIDCDFCYERRQEVIDYVTNKYGADHVAQIITFGTMKARGAIRDVGRVLDIGYNKVDHLAKEIPIHPGHDVTIAEARKENKELDKLEAGDPEIKEILSTAEAIEGICRHASTHAAGVVIADKPLTDYVPLYRNGEAITTQFTMGLLESQGLIKMDFLGLRTLTVIRDAVENIRLSTGKIIDIDKIDMTDPNIFSIISAGDCGGIFQLESSGITSFMKELRPESFEDIIAGISLYRPGPMDQIPRYIANKKNPAGITYLHPSLEPILKVTYGCMVYQEQVMQIFRDLAGFSLGRSDLVRRAMSKKKADVMAHEGDVFIHGEKDENGNTIVDGCLARGIPQNIAEKIWAEMKEFANYAFNKSHAAAYAVIACQTAWLKYYYRAEFMAALMSSVMDQEKKIARYIDECQKAQIRVLPPDVNHSLAKFSVRDGNILFGLGAVKNVGLGMIAAIVEARETYGEFESFRDFCEKTDQSALNKRAVMSLIKAGAFEFTGMRRERLLQGMDLVYDNVLETKKIKMHGQMSMLEMAGFEGPSPESDFPEVPPVSQDKILAMEKEVTGIYISGHPLNKYKKLLRSTSFNFAVADSYEDLSRTARDQSTVQVAGLIKDCRSQLTRNKDLMAFARLEDQFGSVDLVIFPKSYEKYRRLLTDDNPVMVKGKLCYNEEMDVSVTVDAIESLDVLADKLNKVQESATSYKNSSLTLHFTDYSQKILIKPVKSVLGCFPGSMPVILYFEKENKRFKADQKLNVQLNDELIHRLEAVLGNDSVEVV